MKRILCLLAVLISVVSVSAQVITTPNVGLQLPPAGSTNWNLPLNYNFNLLDQLFGGLKTAGLKLAYQPILSTGTPSATCNANNKGQVDYDTTTTPWTEYVCDGVSAWHQGGGGGSGGPTTWGTILGVLGDQTDLAAALAAKAAATSSITINSTTCPLNGSCTIASGGTTVVGQTNYGLGSPGSAQMAAFGDSTMPGSILWRSGAPVNGTGTFDCPGSGSPPGNQGLTYYRSDAVNGVYKIYYCSMTQQIWIEGPAYSSTTTMLFQNYNQQSQYSYGSGTYPYAGTPYSNDSAPLNTGNATTPDVGAIEIFPNENPPDVGAPDYYTLSGVADSFNHGGIWGHSYSNMDLSVRGASIANWMWLGTPLHGKYLARNQTKGGTGTWTDFDPSSATTTATWTAGATTMTVASATGISFGQHVVDNTNGVSLPTPEVVIGVSGTTITLSRPTVAAGSSDTVQFWNTGNSPYRQGVATCGTTGATLTFNFLPASGSMYLAWIVTSGGTATATMLIDGVDSYSLSNNVLGTWDTPHLSTMWYGQRYPLTGTSTHTAVITVTAGSFCPLFAVTPKPASWYGMAQPKVMAGIFPPQSGGYDSTGAIVLNAQQQVTAQMVSDGFNMIPVDMYNLTWPESKGSTGWCEYNYPCPYAGTGLQSNQAAGPHFNWLGNRNNAYAFLGKAGRTTAQFVEGGIDGIPFCSTFAPAHGDYIQLDPVSNCWITGTSTSGVQWSGAWSGSSAYSSGTIVSYNGKGYISKNSIAAPGSPSLVQANGASGRNVSPTSNVTAGHLLIYQMGCRNCTGSGLVPTDTQGNTWVKKNETTANVNNFGTITYITTASTSGPITITGPAIGDVFIHSAVAEFSNVGTTMETSFESSVSTGQSFSPPLTNAISALFVSNLWVSASVTFTAVGSGMALIPASYSNDGSTSMEMAYAFKSPGTYSLGETSGTNFVEEVFDQTSLNTSPDLDTANWFPLSGSGGTVTYTTSTTASTADTGKTVIMNCAAPCAYTLPNPQPSSTWSIRLQSIGSTTATVALGSSMTYNGGASVPVLPKYYQLAISARTSLATDYSGDIPPVQGTSMTIIPASNGITYSSTAVGGSSGLFSGLLTVPTTSSMGLNTYIGTSLGSYTYSNVANGVKIFDVSHASQANPYIEGQVAAYPATPFTATMLVSINSMTFGGTYPALGFIATNNTTTGALYQGLGMSYQGAFDAGGLYGTGLTSYTGTLGGGWVSMFYSPYYWMRYADNGTTITFSVSLDGLIWRVVGTPITKSSSPLNGAYNFFGVFIDNQTSSGNDVGTIIQSWTIQ